MPTQIEGDGCQSGRNEPGRGRDHETMAPVHRVALARPNEVCSDREHSGYPDHQDEAPGRGPFLAEHRPPEGDHAGGTGDGDDPAQVVDDVTDV